MPWVLLFPFRPPILEPNLHLCLGQVQRQREVEALAHGQVARMLELVHQRHELLVGEGRARAAAFASLREVVGVGVGRLRVIDVIEPVDTVRSKSLDLRAILRLGRISLAGSRAS